MVLAVCSSPIALYASDTWTVTQSDSDRIDAFDQWCLRRICGIRWSDHIANVEILRHTSQQPLNRKIVARRRLTLFDHVARMKHSATRHELSFAGAADHGSDQRGGLLHMDINCGKGPGPSQHRLPRSPYEGGEQKVQRTACS